MARDGVDHRKAGSGESVAPMGETQSLIAQSRPVVISVIQSRLHLTHASWWNNEQQRRDAEDLQSEALLQLLIKFRRLEEHATEAPIQDLPSYAAMVAHQVCNQYLRRKYPQRTRLSDQLRYLFTHQPGWQIWGDATERLCGFTAWRAERRRAVTINAIRQVCEEPQKLTSAFSARLDWQRLPLAELCERVLQYFDAPVGFAELVTLVARLRQTADPTPTELAAAQSDKRRMDGNVVSSIEERLYLERVWQEIARLPLPHRTALLLNLGAATERGILLALVELGVVSIKQLAAALEMPPFVFAELWPHLPLSDYEIAARLECTRQQVINLRSSARRQLAKRLR